MSVPRCRFCGCTERRPCRLVAVKEVPDREAYILAAGAIAIVPKEAQTFLVPCAWLPIDDDICSNPTCVEKAYAEARDAEFVEALQGLIDLGLVEVSDDEERLVVTEAGHAEAARPRRLA